MGKNVGKDFQKKKQSPAPQQLQLGNERDIVMGPNAKMIVTHGATNAKVRLPM